MYTNPNCINESLASLPQDNLTLGFLAAATYRPWTYAVINPRRVVSFFFFDLTFPGIAGDHYIVTWTEIGTAPTGL